MSRSSVPPLPKVTVLLLSGAPLVVVIAGIRAAEALLVPFLLAVFVAMICSPPLFWLREKGVPKPLALMIVVVGAVSLGLAAIAFLGSAIEDFSESLPGYRERFDTLIADAVTWLEARGIDTNQATLSKYLDPGAAVRFAGTLLSGLGGALSNVFIILLIAVFMLLEVTGLPKKIDALPGDKNKRRARLHEFTQSLEKYIVIKTIVSFMTGAIVGIWLWVLGVDNALLWALLAFGLNFVPNIGSVLAAVPAVLLALVQLGLGSALLAALGYILVNLLMGNVIEPKYMGKGVGLTPLVVVLSLIFWGWVLGPVGMFLSVPLTMTIKMALLGNEETRWVVLFLGPAEDDWKPLEKSEETE
ncbi:MAG: AI-2E family transporter [Acidobacteriota bacterium]|nr:AI-2E family transporter [Acidobacteriota bacterium]